MLREIPKTVQSGFKNPEDTQSTFGQQVAAEVRQINDLKLRTRAKKNVMTILYDIQEQDQNMTHHAHKKVRTPYTTQGVFQVHPQVQMQPPPSPCFMQMLQDSEAEIDV